MNTFSPRFTDASDAVGVIALAISTKSRKKVDPVYIFENFVSEEKIDGTVYFIPELPEPGDYDDEMFDKNVWKALFS